MHVSGFSFDLYPLLQFVFTACVIVIGILHLVKSTASKYFVVDANFEEGGGGEEALLESRKKNRSQMIAVDGCAVCGKNGIKQCSRCKSVRYCSGNCQSKHWKEGHNLKCQELKLSGGINAKPSVSCGKKAAVCDSKYSKELPQLKKVLFPYEDFVKLFNWENSGFRPCGLLNCGNSCYANVVLQCLSCTRPLIAYLLEIGHAIKCKRNDWCFLCELEVHVERARRSWQPFSPINILSRLPNIGGNLGYGKQEDAHEFMRFAIDTMQSVCLDEFGGEKALHPSSQETSLIQYIFGGHLQSQVKCLKCNKISYRHENMMDLTVEIQGDSESLEECLDQFTAEEWLDGENMYKCDGCNDYVKACKRLAIHHAPNILTIALKRFQSGRFGKLNKRVTFPETLNLGPYMSKPGYDTDFYRLYAVVVHIDMLNASYFGHYVCYTKDFRGNWYRIDDCKVTTVELEEVLSQGAYMLLYSRMCVRPSCVNPLKTCKEEKQEAVEEAQPCSQAAVDSITIDGSSESSTTIPSTCTDVRSPTEEEKQQGVDVVEEAQPCLRLPVESITIEGSLNSLSTMPTDSNEDDSVCMNLDDPIEVNSRFAEEDPAPITAPPAEEEKQQGVDVAEEAQPCLRLPVKSITVEGSVNSLSNMPTDSNHDDSVCMNLDDSLEFNSRFAEEEPASTTAGVPIDSESSSLDMDLDGPIRLDLIPAREYQLNPESSSLGRMLDDCGSKHSDATEIASSVEVLYGGVSTSDPLSEDLPLVKAHNLDHCFEDGNRTTENRASILNELPADDSLPSQSAIYESNIPQQGNYSSLCSPLNLKLEQVNAVRPGNVIPAAPITKRNASKPVRDESCSNGKQSPLFFRGFIDKDKRVRCQSPNRNGKVLVKPVEVGSYCKVSSNCNGFIACGVSQNINVVHDLNGTLNSDGQRTHSLANGESEKFVDGVGLGHDCSSLNIVPPFEHFNSDGQHTPSLVTGKSEKFLNGVGPSHDCSSSSLHVVEIAPLTEPSVPTEAYDLGHELNGPGFNVEHTFGNGNSCNKSASEAVGSLSSQIEHEMDEISSSVPLCSDIEMLDESTCVISSQSQQSPSLVEIASVELGNGIHAARNMEACPSNKNKGNSCSRRPKPDFLDKKTRGKVENRRDGLEGLGKVESSSEDNKCNGSLVQTSAQANNFERNFDCDVENQCKKVFMDVDEGEDKAVGDGGHCNGNGSCNNLDEMVSSNHDRNKLARFG